MQAVTDLTLMIAGGALCITGGTGNWLIGLVCLTLYVVRG